METTDTQQQVFENGLTLLTTVKPGTGLVAVEIVVRTGSVFEDTRLGTGVAHLLEHMLFKGSAQWPQAADINTALAALGADINGYTGHTMTGYTLCVPAERFVPALAVFADMLQHPVLCEQELLKEKDVILSEIRLNRDDVNRYGSRLFWRTAYAGSVYALPVIGEEALFSQLTRADVLDFYQRWYMPNNTVIAIAGDICRDSIQKTVAELFGDWAMRPYPVVRLPPAPAPAARQSSEPFETEMTHVNVGLPGVDLWHPDAPALDVLGVVLGQGQSARLYQRLVVKDRTAFSVQAANYSPEFRGVFYITLKATPETSAAALAAMWDELRVIAQQPLSAADLKKAVNSYISQQIFSRETVESVAAQLIQDEVVAGDRGFSQRYLDALRAVTPADVRRCAQTYLLSSQRVVTQVQPRRPLDACATAVAPAMAVTRKELLAGGARLIIRENTRQPVFSVVAAFHGGTRFENSQDNGIFYLLSQLLLRGTRRRSALQIAEQLEQRGASLQPFSGYNSFGLVLEGLSVDLPETIDIMFDVLFNAVVAEEQLIRERDLALQAISLEQDSIFRDTINQLRAGLFARYPYRLSTLGQEESVRALARQQIIERYRRFVAPANMVITVSGDFGGRNMSELLRPYFNRRQAGSVAQIEFEPEMFSVAARHIAHHRDKEQAVVMLGMPTVAVSDRRRYALDVLMQAVGGGSGSLLYQRIREEQGLAYTVGGQAVHGMDTGYWFVYAATSPEQSEHVLAEIRDQLAHIVKHGVPEPEIEKARTQLIADFRKSTQKNQTVAFQMALDELYGLGFDRLTQYEEHIAAIGADELRQVAEEFLQPERMVTVITQKQI